MFRILALVMLLPTYAAADWSPRPSMFTYDAAFDVCTIDPAAPDLVTVCTDALTAAYVLKREVALAVVECHPQSLATCAIPFEDRGMPAFAAQIAASISCDTTDISQLSNGARFSPDHCITVTSDIMADEGVVPLDTIIICGRQQIECGELAKIQAAFWSTQVEIAAEDNMALAADLQSRNREDCGAHPRGPGGWSADLDALACIADRSAALWADLVTPD